MQCKTKSIGFDGCPEKDRNVMFERHHPEIIGKPKSKLSRFLNFKNSVNRGCEKVLGKLPKILQTHPLLLQKNNTVAKKQQKPM
jgi:hypothetical protein